MGTLTGVISAAVTFNARLSYIAPAGPSPALAGEGSNSRQRALERSDFLAQEDGVGHTEADDSQGNDAGDVRPDQQQALVERQRAGGHRQGFAERNQSGGSAQLRIEDGRSGL